MKKLISFFHKQRLLVENFSYITLLQVFQLVSPLITYPYLVKVLGRELYSIIITAQVLVSYATIIINWGTDRVCAKHVSIYRDDDAKLSEIISSVLISRTILWVVSLIFYIIIVLCVPLYREHLLLFIFTYGFTFHEWLFPQFFFQGLEKMKFTSLVNLFTKIFFIVLVFFVVKSKEDYIYVPLLYSIGFLVSSIYSLYEIFVNMRIKFYMPDWTTIRYYLKDSSFIFATEIISTIKDKVGYFILGGLSMSDVVVYDLGMKITRILVKPGQILATVLFPRFAKNKNTNQFKKIFKIELIGILILVILVNIFLPEIVFFFINEHIELIPLRLFTLAPVFLVLSSFISSNLLVAFGYNRYMLYSIIITTIGYLLCLSIVFFTGDLNGLFSLVIVAVVSYGIEFIYRMILAVKLIRQEELTIRNSDEE